MKKLIGILILFISILSFGDEYKAPDFNLKDQYGIEHSLEKYKGKIVVLNFWATWCSVCKKEIKDIEKLYIDYNKNEEDVIFLGVNNENPEKVKKYLDKNEVKFPTIIGEDIMDQYYIRAFPTIYILDQEGNIYKYAMGAVPTDVLREVIDDKLKKSN